MNEAVVDHLRDLELGGRELVFQRREVREDVERLVLRRAHGALRGANLIGPQRRAVNLVTALLRRRPAPDHRSDRSKETP